MAYIKPEQFFKMYSGQNIDEIRAWITDELSLQLTDIDWIAIHPIHYGSRNEMRVEAEIITSRGEKHSTHTSTASTITYHGTTQDDKNE